MTLPHSRHRVRQSLPIAMTLVWTMWRIRFIHAICLEEINSYLILIMIQTFQNYLTNRGISSSFLDQTQTLLSFQHNDINFLFSYRRIQDPTYVRLMIPNIGTLDVTNSQEILRLCQLTSQYKVGKFIIEDSNQIWIVAEAFLYIQADHARLFDRLLSVLIDMFNEYRSITHGE